MSDNQRHGAATHLPNGEDGGRYPAVDIDVDVEVSVGRAMGKAVEEPIENAMKTRKEN
jgi:hypothetical protein